MILVEENGTKEDNWYSKGLMCTGWETGQAARTNQLIYGQKLIYKVGAQYFREAQSKYITLPAMPATHWANWHIFTLKPQSHLSGVSALRAANSLFIVVGIA